MMFRPPSLRSVGLRFGVLATLRNFPRNPLRVGSDISACSPFFGCICCVGLSAISWRVPPWLPPLLAETPDGMTVTCVTQRSRVFGAG